MMSPGLQMIRASLPLKRMVRSRSGGLLLAIASPSTAVWSVDISSPGLPMGRTSLQAQ